MSRSFSCCAGIFPPYSAEMEQQAGIHDHTTAVDVSARRESLFEVFSFGGPGASFSF